MSVVVVQHVPGEAPCAIATALESAGLRTRLCRVWEGDPLPESLIGVEALVVTGGPTRPGRPAARNAPPDTPAC